MFKPDDCDGNKDRHRTPLDFCDGLFVLTRSELFIDVNPVLFYFTLFQ